MDSEIESEFEDDFDDSDDLVIEDDFDVPIYIEFQYKFEEVNQLYFKKKFKEANGALSHAREIAEKIGYADKLFGYAGGVYWDYFDVLIKILKMEISEFNLNNHIEQINFFIQLSKLFCDCSKHSFEFCEKLSYENIESCLNDIMCDFFVNVQSESSKLGYSVLDILSFMIYFISRNYLQFKYDEKIEIYSKFDLESNQIREATKIALSLSIVYNDLDEDGKFIEYVRSKINSGSISQFTKQELMDCVFIDCKHKMYIESEEIFKDKIESEEWETVPSFIRRHKKCTGIKLKIILLVLFHKLNQYFEISKEEIKLDGIYIEKNKNIRIDCSKKYRNGYFNLCDVFFNSVLFYFNTILMFMKSMGNDSDLNLFLQFVTEMLPKITRQPSETLNELSIEIIKYITKYNLKDNSEYKFDLSKLIESTRTIFSEHIENKDIGRKISDFIFNEEMNKIISENIHSIKFNQEFSKRLDEFNECEYPDEFILFICICDLIRNEIEQIKELVKSPYLDLIGKIHLVNINNCDRFFDTIGYYGVDNEEADISKVKGLDIDKLHHFNGQIQVNINNRDQYFDTIGYYSLNYKEADLSRIKGLDVDKLLDFLSDKLSVDKESVMIIRNDGFLSNPTYIDCSRQLEFEFIYVNKYEGDIVREEIDLNTIDKSKQGLYFIKEIDAGSFATVHLYKCFPQKCDRALKIIPKPEKFNKNDKTVAILSEINLLISKTHPNIVQVYNLWYKSFENGTFFFLEMEYIDGGNLTDLMKEQKNEIFEIKQIRTYLKEIVKGLEFLHLHNIIHIDLKLDNILIDSSRTICKLTDFGSSRRMRDKSVKLLDHVISTAYYMSPELINEEPYSTSTDIWSLGAVIVEMCTGKPPYRHFGDLNAKLEIGKTKSLSCFSKTFPEKIREIVDNCTKSDPDERITAAQLLECDFLKN